MTESHSPAAVQTMALLGSYVPRQCGIATFTNDLRNALAVQLGEREASVIAMDDRSEGYEYGPEVRFQIPQHKQADYVTAADLLNINQTDCLLIQHEYGIFGGRDGSYVLDLIRNCRMPVISTLHTVLQDPSPNQKLVLKELARLSDRVVVMSQRAHAMLESIYAVPSNKIAHIPHGIHDVPFVDPHFFRDQFGLEGRKVLLTFGLLSPGKGIEVAIRALPKIVEKNPDAVYIILGATHPHILKNEGNAYRHSLEKLVAQLGMTDHVQFHNRYVGLKELVRYIGLADVYVTPYPNRQQITSGTLAYAVGAGKPVVSTPYWHAEEMLAEGRGRLFDFGNSDQMAEQVNDLLANENERHAIRKRAYLHGRPMVWKEVAKSYIKLAGEVIDERRSTPRPTNLPGSRSLVTQVAGIPDISLAHLRRLSDSAGIFQHAVYATPNRHHGYCTDDNSRALLTALMHFDQNRDESVLPLIDTYLAAMHYAYDEPNRRFRNFMSYDRRWMDESISEDVHGRSIWALGTAVALAPNDSILSVAVRLLHSALEISERATAPRAWAFTIVGLSAYLTRFAGDTIARRVRQSLAHRLNDHFKCTADEAWPWCEEVVTYDNAKLCHALIVAGSGLGDDDMLQRGLSTLQWLVDHQLTDDGRVSLIGNHGWLRKDGTRARFDQQPIEAMAMVEASAAAYRATSDPKWFNTARTFLDWFTGNNELGTPLYDYQTGGCRDGLHADGPNLNQGAESTLAWLISALTMNDLIRLRTLETATADAITPPPASHVDRPFTGSTPVGGSRSEHHGAVGSAR